MKILFTALFLLLAPAALSQEEEFSGLTGIPVMDGLEEVSEARLVFDKPEGRIVQARFNGALSARQVMAFYRETLFQLGWVLDNQKSEADRAEFTRDGERLAIAITGLEPLEVTLEVGPED